MNSPATMTQFSRPSFLALLAALVAAPAAAQTADQASALSAVARLMADVRADPAKARGAKCPANLRTLAGVPVGSVLIELGQAEGPQGANALTYRVAGFGEVTFRFNAQGVVTSAECKPSK